MGDWWLCNNIKIAWLFFFTNYLSVFPVWLDKNDFFLENLMKNYYLFRTSLRISEYNFFRLELRTLHIKIFNNRVLCLIVCNCNEEILILKVKVLLKPFKAKLRLTHNRTVTIRLNYMKFLISCYWDFNSMIREFIVVTNYLVRSFRDQTELLSHILSYLELKSGFVSVFVVY